MARLFLVDMFRFEEAMFPPEDLYSNVKVIGYPSECAYSAGLAWAVCRATLHSRSLSSKRALDGSLVYNLSS